MMIFNLEEIKKVEQHMPILITKLENGYVKFTKGETNVPPVGYLQFDKPVGNTFIKYGHVNGDDSFVIKIFNGFPENSELGLPTSDGMNIVFDANTGMTKAILLDNGWLTGFRTAAATLIAAKYLAPKKITKFGILGTGTQAHAILDATLKFHKELEVVVYGYTKELIDSFVAEYAKKGVKIAPAYDVSTLCEQANYIVSCTNTTEPLIYGDMVKPGSLVIGMGADTVGKNEIDASLYAKADMIVCDYIDQCEEVGDTRTALEKGAVKKSDLIELGNLILEGKTRENDEQICVVDLTGIAVQDIVVAEMVCDVLTGTIK